MIVLHTTDGFGKNNFNWFNSPQSQSSSHFGVMLDGTIEQYVEIDDTAWHAGNWAINQASIGIEFDDNKNPNDSIRTNELYSSGIELICFLIEELEKKYPNSFKASATNDFLSHFIRVHREFVPTKTCPAGLDIDRIKKGVLEFLKKRESNNNNIDSIETRFFEIEKKINYFSSFLPTIEQILSDQNNKLAEFKNSLFSLQDFVYEKCIKTSDFESLKLVVESLKNESEFLKKEFYLLKDSLDLLNKINFFFFKLKEVFKRFLNKILNKKV
ncbi:MAG: N-acetylmuramoyl-L-alanine amidase [Candidatus Dojkabacteria bacterium]|nr:N-acetylmuramoyl-L-alanine amidase [Candidatus Dojkabacteria bacterium]